MLPLPASLQVRVEGLLRHGEDPGDFVPPNEPEQGACRAMGCVFCAGCNLWLCHLCRWLALCIPNHQRRHP